MARSSPISASPTLSTRELSSVLRKAMNWRRSSRKRTAQGSRSRSTYETVGAAPNCYLWPDGEPAALDIDDAGHRHRRGGGAGVDQLRSGLSTLCHQPVPGSLLEPADHLSVAANRGRRQRRKDEAADNW